MKIDPLLRIKHNMPAWIQEDLERTTLN